MGNAVTLKCPPGYTRTSEHGKDIDPYIMTNIPWADILPAAVAVTLSPVPIMAAILALFGQHPRQNGLSFLVGWVARLESFPPGQILPVAIGLCVINPKNLTLTLAILLALGEADLPAWQAVLGLAVFVVLGSLTIAVPVFYAAIALQLKTAP